MTTMLVIMTVLTYGLLIVLAGFHPLKSALSSFELRRLLKAGDPHAETVQKRMKHIDEVMSIINLFRVVLVIAMLYMLVLRFGLFAGIIIGGALLLIIPAISRQKIIVKMGRSFHLWLERHLFRFTYEYGRYFRFLRGFDFWEIKNIRVHSRQEMAYLVEHADFLAQDERDHLGAALKFESLGVETVMADIAKRATVSQNDLMGPLLLHELHETGEDVFPVTENASSLKVVGVVSISHLLTLEDKTSHKVKYFMNTNFPRFDQGTKIKDCIKEFGETKEFIGIVYDDDELPCGVVSLEDCLKSVFGQK